MSDVQVEARRRAQLASVEAKLTRTIVLSCRVCGFDFTTTADRACATTCGPECRKIDRQAWHQAHKGARTRDRRQDERRRAAAAKGRPYLTTEERAARKAERLAAAQRSQAARRALGLSPEQRRERDRLRSARYYKANRAKKIKKADEYRRVARSSAEYRRMESACVKRWASKNPDKTRAIRFNREARKRRGFVEVVDPRVVFARDKGCCGVCRLPVAPQEAWHIDHVIPLSRGGQHSYANTQLAHAECNIKKGSALPGEARGVPPFGSFQPLASKRVGRARVSSSSRSVYGFAVRT